MIKNDPMARSYAIYKLKFGYFRIEQEDNTIIYLKRISKKPTKMGTPTTLTNLVARQLRRYFNGEQKQLNFPYKLYGTNFQKQVWEELIKIPYGETCSYKQIAMKIGNPNASRAIGMANNKNPITIMIPCHRVIGSNGNLTGYSGGLSMKIAILKIESENKITL